MKLFLLFTLVLSELLELHYNIQNQLLEKIQDRLNTGDYACLDLDEHYIIHIIELNRSELKIRRFDKLHRITNTIIIKLDEHVDEDLNLKESLKAKIIQQLYSFGDREIKYIFISEDDELYKNRMYLYELLKNLSSYTHMIENYDESKRDYLNYKSIIRNDLIFASFTFAKTLDHQGYFVEDFDKELFSLTLSGAKNEKYFLKFNIGSFDLNDYFRYYYAEKKVVSKKDADEFLKFVKNFNFELLKIDLILEIIDKVTDNFIFKKTNMESENIRLTRKIDLKINEKNIIWNSICYFYDEEISFDENLECLTISKKQFEGIKNYYSIVTGMDRLTLLDINRLMNVLKGSEIYITVLKNILNNKDSKRGIILINILYSLAIITKSQFKDYLYYQNSANIDIKNITNQINSHYESIRFTLYNTLLYFELCDIASNPNDELDFFKEFNQILSLASVKEKMNLSDNKDYSIMTKLNIFIEEVYYKTINEIQNLILCHFFIMPLLISEWISNKSIVDENLILKYSEGNFEKKYLQTLYEGILTSDNNN